MSSPVKRGQPPLVLSIRICSSSYQEADYLHLTIAGCLLERTVPGEEGWEVQGTYDVTTGNVPTRNGASCCSINSVNDRLHENRMINISSKPHLILEMQWPAVLQASFHELDVSHLYSYRERVVVVILYSQINCNCDPNSLKLLKN